MKIAFYMTTILEHGGGAEKYLQEQAKVLSNFDDIHVDIITMDDAFNLKINSLLNFYYLRKLKKESLFNESLKYIKSNLGKANYYKINTFKNLKNKLNRYDVIYSRNELLEAFIFKFLIGYKKLPPIIFGCHTAVFYPKQKTIQSKLHNFLYNGFFYKFLASGVYKFHVINSFDKKQLSKLFPQKDVVKIYNPFNYNEFIQNLEKYKYNFGWDKSKINIIWVGKLTEQKGVDDLVDIIDKLNELKYIDKFIWNICGEGSEKYKILNLKNKWKNINYFGHVENRYMASIYKQNSLCISTSHWEGFPFNLIEAQSMNLPILSYNIAGCNDIIDNEVNGILVKDIIEFRERIIDFYNKKYLFCDLNKYIFLKFNKNIIYKQLINLFKK